MSAWDWLKRTLRRVLMELYRENKQQLQVIVDSYIERTLESTEAALVERIKNVAMKRLLEQGVKILKTGAAEQANTIIEAAIQEVLKEE